LSPFVSLDDYSSSSLTESVVSTVLSHNKPRYIPLFSSGRLIRKAQAILQDLPQVLTNLVSYLLATSRITQLTASIFKFRVPVKLTLSFFPLSVSY